MNRWDKYFYELTQTVATNSQCLSRKIGAIIVRDKSIIATGYNGPARGIPKCDVRPIYQQDKLIHIPEASGKCPRYAMGYKSGQGLDLCIAAHAEQNCIVNAARLGVSTYGASIYMNCEVPCKYCLSLIINAGIKEVICAKLKTYDEQTNFIICNSDLIIRDFNGNLFSLNERS